MQGYNAQAVANEHQIVIAAEVNADSSDFGHLEAMVSTARESLSGRVSATRSRSWSRTPATGTKSRWRACQQGDPGLDPAGRGQTSEAQGPVGTAAPTPTCDASLEAELGGELYRKRKAMIEPVFANTKFNRRIDRFLRRGRSAVRSEWRLITATHNLVKLHKHQIAAAGA